MPRLTWLEIVHSDWVFPVLIWNHELLHGISPVCKCCVFLKSREHFCFYLTFFIFLTIQCLAVLQCKFQVIPSLQSTLAADTLGGQQCFYVAADKSEDWYPRNACSKCKDRKELALKWCKAAQVFVESLSKHCNIKELYRVSHSCYMIYFLS
jgi:hypothetical protein